MMPEAVLQRQAATGKKASHVYAMVGICHSTVKSGHHFFQRFSVRAAFRCNMTDVVCGDMIAKMTGRLGHYPFLLKEGKGLAIVSRHDAPPAALTDCGNLVSFCDSRFAG
jgi:hypothetical protein